jgi:hypothetical protein
VNRPRTRPGNPIGDHREEDHRASQTLDLADAGGQHEKVIAVWTQIEPLPRVIETPAVILVGMVAFGLAFALLYRSVPSAWPAGIHPRAWRLALVIWLATVFSEFMGSFNVLHQPLSLSVLRGGCGR